MKRHVLMCALAVAAAVGAVQSARANPLPSLPSPVPPKILPPVFRPTTIHADEKPVEIKTEHKVVEEVGGFLRRIEATITFTNPNQRVFEGELELPLPKGAVVCGYELEVNGTMVPGVVCPKEAARIAFENEKRKGIDPGIVEHVKGDVWRTRIYPLMPNVPRKAKVTYVALYEHYYYYLVALSGYAERDGDYVYSCRKDSYDRNSQQNVRRRRRWNFRSKGTIYWDASLSHRDKHKENREYLASQLGKKGEWRLIVFRNVIERPLTFTDRDELLRVVDALAYDGGTCLDEVEKVAKMEDAIFTDEKDYSSCRQFYVIDRCPANEYKWKWVPFHKGERKPFPRKSLATLWAAQRIEELSVDAERNKKELLEIGRAYGVASPVTSIIVLETLDQYLTYRIEPPKGLPFHDEWVRRRAAEDDPIAATKEKAEYRSRLLGLWEKRVKWWNDPIPPKQTPHSGVFGEQEEVRTYGMSSQVKGLIASDSRRSREMTASVSSEANEAKALPRAAGGKATVKVAAWNPDMPYLKQLDAAKKGDAYAVYLREREDFIASPAFYFDCANWFFKAGERMLAIRILSNLTEMKLEDPALWRTMGWRLREADAYGEAVAVFRHVLEMRGEEAQSRRDLALVLTEHGKALFAAGDRAGAAQALGEAMRLLHEAAFEPAARRSGRRSNDMQTSVLAVEELNGLMAWVAARDWGDVKPPEAPAFDKAFMRTMPLKLRIVMSWDFDETDVDLHVLEPDGEEAYYGHRRTSSGGFVSEDVTTGYGPEEYLRKEVEKGVYKIMAHYYASHRQALTGAATVTASVYTDWGTKDERREVYSFRLDKPRDKQVIGEVKVE